MGNNYKTAVVYHYFAQYREPILKLLCQQEETNPQYVLYSGTKTEIKIKTIDPEKRKIRISEGGLRWIILHNIWFGKVFLWQTGLINLALSKEFKAIIYLGQIYHLSTWVSAIIARITGKKVFMWTHGYIENENNLKGWIRLQFYKLANGLFLYGNRAKSILIRKGYKEENLHIVYNSLDYDSQVSLRKSLDDLDVNAKKKKLFIHTDLPVAYFIGRLTPQKNLNMLFEAAKILHDKGHRINLLFIGDGSELALMKEKAEKLSLTNYVHFYGACHKETEISKLIYLCDVCVSPGEVGLTAIHSLAYGTPVVTHNNPSTQMPEYEAIQDGITGALFEEGNVCDLALKIKYFTHATRSKKQVKKDCYAIIDELYNPHYQVNILNQAIVEKMHSGF